MASKKELQEKLDFTGHLFDASFAIQNPAQALKRLPCQNAKTFNNLDEYHKKTFGRSTIPNKQEVIGEPERKFTPQQIAACSKPTKCKWKDPPDVLNKMAEATGPLSLLNMCLGQRITVSIRRRKLGPVSSHYEKVFGQLVAFDKHLNMVLMDVDRVIIVNDQKRERHTNQLFLRGDNVIYVAKF